MENNWEALKKKGNDLFQKAKDQRVSLKCRPLNNQDLRQMYDDAIDAYSEAIKLKPDNHILYGNRSQVKIQVAEWEPTVLLHGTQAFKDAKKSISLNPKWSKGYYRTALCLRILRKYKNAAQTIDAGLKAQTEDDKTLIEFQDCLKKWEVTDVEDRFRGLYNNIARGNISVLKEWLDEAGEANRRIKDQGLKGFTLMHLACSIAPEVQAGQQDKPKDDEKNRLAIVDLLLKNGGDPNLQDYETTSTPLAIASSINYPTIVQRLIDSGAKVNQSQQDGKDALICASVMGHIDCVKILLNGGATLENRFQNFTALEQAMIRKHQDIVDAIKEKFGLQ